MKDSAALLKLIYRISKGNITMIWDAWGGARRSSVCRLVGWGSSRSGSKPRSQGIYYIELVFIKVNYLRYIWINLQVPAAISLRCPRFRSQRELGILDRKWIYNTWSALFFGRPCSAVTSRPAVGARVASPIQFGGECSTAVACARNWYAYVDRIHLLHRKPKDFPALAGI